MQVGNKLNDGLHSTPAIDQRSSQAATTDQLPVLFFCIGGCGGTHCWAQEIKALGFALRVIPPACANSLLTELWKVAESVARQTFKTDKLYDLVQFFDVLRQPGQFLL